MIDFTHLNGKNGTQPHDGPQHAEKLTPQSLQGEQSTLGAMLMDAEAATKAINLLEKDDFYRANHRLIFDTVCTLRAEGKPVDVVTVILQLHAVGELANVGGADYIAALVEACPSAANVSAYAGVVKAESVRRQLIHAANTAATAAYANDADTLTRALRELHNAQQTAATGTERFKLWSWEDLRRRPKRAWLVESLLLERSLAVMFGAGATFKSFMALDLALHLSSGRDWHGKQITPGRVVYTAGEGIDGLCDRLDAWTNRYQVRDLPNFKCVTEVPKLCDEADVARLVARVKAQFPDPVLVVIDTLAWAMEGNDENNTGDMTRATSAAKRIRDELGCAVLIVHHTNKNGLLRGNEALRNNVDTMIEVRAEERRITLHCNKQKDRENFTDMTFLGGVVEIEGGSSLVFEPTTGQPVGRKLPEKQQLAFNILKHQHPEGASSDLWMLKWTGLGEKERTFRDVRSKLILCGAVRQEGEIFIAEDVSK